jgi:hypothetical protein
MALTPFLAQFGGKLGQMLEKSDMKALQVGGACGGLPRLWRSAPDQQGARAPGHTATPWLPLFRLHSPLLGRALLAPRSPRRVR